MVQDGPVPVGGNLNMSLPDTHKTRLMKDYAYLWIKGGCPLHQWVSGARGIDNTVCQHVANLMIQVITPIPNPDYLGLRELLEWLCDHHGSPAEPYLGTSRV